MIEPRRPRIRASGFTLVELMVATTIAGIVALLATRTFVAFVKDDAMRRKVTDVQKRTRTGIELLSREFRHASLGAGTGRIWTSSNGNRVVRPAVQVFQNVGGAGTLDIGAKAPGAAGPKPGTDALLVVEAVGRERSATVGEITPATTGMPNTFNVTTLSTTDEDGAVHTLAPDEPILVGDYREASWGIIQSLDAGPQITLKSDLTLPGFQVPKLAAGALVRRARARLYYVDTLDQLVRLELLVPRAPALASEIDGGEILATGVENLQVACEMSAGTGALDRNVAPLEGTHAITTESGAAFSFGTFGGPSLQAEDESAASSVSKVREIALGVLGRSPTEVVDAFLGDKLIAVDGVMIGDGDKAYVRRAYRLGAGVRNTSLGDM